MKRVISKISFYWALQLISTALLYNLAQDGLCQAKGIKERKSYLVKLEFMAGTILPNDRINVSIDIGSVSKLDRTKYSLEIIEVLVGKKRGGSKSPPIQRQVLPLKSLLSEQELAGATYIWIKAASNARKIIASSPQRQAYTLICRIVDTKGQRVSNEIKKTVRTNNGVSLTRAIIGGLISSAVVYVALAIFDKLYRYFSTNPGSGPRKTIIGSIIDFERDKTLCCTILDIDKDDVSDFTAIAKAYEQKRLKESLDAAGKTGKEKAKANKRLQILGEAKKWLEKNCNTDLYIRFINARWIYDLYQQAHKFNLGGALTWEIIQTIIDKEVATDFMRDRTLCCEILDIEEDHVLNLMEVQNSYDKKVDEELPDAAGTTGTEEQKSQERAKATKRLQILGEAKKWLEKDLKGSFSLYIRFFDASWIATFYQQVKKFKIELPNEELTWGIIEEIIDEEFTIDFITDRLLCCKILGIEEDCARDLSKVHDAYFCKCGKYLKMGMSKADLREKTICEYAKNWLEDNRQGLFFPYQRSIHAKWIDKFYRQANDFNVALSNGNLTWEIIQKIIDKEVGASSSSGFGFGTGFGTGTGTGFGFGSELITELATDRTLCCEILEIGSQEIVTQEVIKKAYKAKVKAEHPDKVGKTGTEQAKATKRFQILNEAREWLEKNLKKPSSLYIRSIDASWIHTFYQQANTFNVALSNRKLTWGIIQTIINQEFGTGSDPSTSTSTGSGPELTTDFTIDKKLCCEILGIQEYSSVDSAVLNKAYSSRNLTAGLHTPGSTEMEKNKRRTMQATLKNAQNWLGTISSFKNRYLRSRDASWIDTFYQQAKDFNVALPKQELTWEAIQTIIDKRVEARLQQLQT